MPQFKHLAAAGIVVGCLAGGTVALFTNKRKAAPSSADESNPSRADMPTVPIAPLADEAAALNDEGKKLLFAGEFAEASSMFRDAVARVPEPKYFYNLATSLFQEGRFGEALTAVDAVRVRAREWFCRSSRVRNGSAGIDKLRGVVIYPSGGRRARDSREVAAVRADHG